MTGLPEHDVSQAHSRIQQRHNELLARGWHGPYYTRADLYDLALDRWIMRQQVKAEGGRG